VGDQLHGMTETLDRAAVAAATVSDNIDGHRASLRPAVEALRGQWEGTARTAFETAHQQWEEGVMRLTTALRSLGENTAFSSHTYTQADEANAAQLHQVTSLGAFGGRLSS
jgi:WXG100 family type VII secretion target